MIVVVDYNTVVSRLDRCNWTVSIRHRGLVKITSRCLDINLIIFHCYLFGVPKDDYAAQNKYLQRIRLCLPLQ
jgi:hypothetical protein